MYHARSEAGRGSVGQARLAKRAQAWESAAVTEPPSRADAEIVAPPSPERPTLGAPAGQVVGWAVLAIVNAVTICLTIPLASDQLARRAQHHLYDAGQLLAPGLAAAALVELWARLRLEARFGRLGAFLLDLGAIFALSLGVGAFVLVDDLGNLGGRLAEGLKIPLLERVVLPSLVVLVAAGIPLAAALGRLLDRRFLRWLGVALLLALGVANELVLRNDYPGAHLYLAWAAATLAGAALAGLSLPRALGARAVRVGALVARGGLSLIAGYTLVVWPGTVVMMEMFKTSGAVLAPYMAVLRHSAGKVDERFVAPEARPWFDDRTSAPKVPPTGPSPDDASRIVLMLFIDSLRADVLTTPAYAATLPELSALKQRGSYFSEARSPGNGTVYAFTQTFASRYFSELYWTQKGPGGGIFAHEDTSPRFPSLLAAAGVPTVTFSSAIWLANGWGVVEGFTEEQVINPKTITKIAPKGSELVDPVIARLARHGGGPLFLFIHFMDAHFPYDRAGNAGSAFDRYLRELRLVDDQLGRLRAAIDERGLASRTTVIVTADHGEAFGEHGTHQHGVTLYDELVHVPLIIASPGAPAGAIEQPVSLIDLGPTVLDLFGQPTPGSYMGQSLVPFLRGQRPTLTRPIIAESRLKQSLLFPDRVKVIRDQRRGTEEAYDLVRDPLELRNLCESSGDALDARFGALELFFRAHQLRRRGYVPPYRP
jgi:hypothetical protein